MFLKIKPALAHMLPRLAEKSTIVGLMGLLSIGFGFAVAPERVEAIAVIVSTVSGIALMLMRETSSLPIEAQVVAKLMETGK